MMAELSPEPPRTPNLRDSSPLGSLIRRTSSRRVQDSRKPANLELMPSPPRPHPASSAGAIPPPPHSPILHTAFRNSTATAVSYYDDGASMRTISWDARSGSPPSTPSSSYTGRAPNQAHESVASYDIDSIIPTCRDFEERLIKLLWRSRPNAPNASSHPTSQSSHPASINGAYRVASAAPPRTTHADAHTHPAR